MNKRIFHRKLNELQTEFLRHTFPLSDAEYLSNIYQEIQMSKKSMNIQKKRLQELLNQMKSNL